MKCTIKIDGWDEIPVGERAKRLIELASASCSSMRCSLTLWLLFDTATGRDSFVRDELLKRFRAHSKAFGKPRSVNEGAKWLAHYAGV